MFSVLVPVFNHGRFLRAAVESAVRDPLVGEVLLADDGSSDDSPRVIESLTRAYGRRVRNVTGRKANIGAHARLNQLVDAAALEWLAVLNSDDAFMPSRFAVARARIASSRGANTEFVSGHLLVMDAEGRTFGRKRGWLDPEYPFPEAVSGPRGPQAEPAWQEAFRALLVNQNFIATTSNMLFTRGLHARLGGFRDYRYCHDWDFALRAAFDGPVGWCDSPLTLYRIHGGNTIAEPAERVRGEVARMLDRLRVELPALGATPWRRAALSGNAYLRAA
jgi:glycosyltransferase involved in cell wall biosynthesis